MKYDVDYFIKKFKAIPASKWTTGEYVKDTKYCALGHCGANKITGYGHIEEAVMLSKLLGTADTVTAINDGEHAFYQQKTPRARILAALKTAKARK